MTNYFIKDAKNYCDVLRSGRDLTVQTRDLTVQTRGLTAQTRDLTLRFPAGVFMAMLLKRSFR
jgi:hypothetical protein